MYLPKSVYIKFIVVLFIIAKSRNISKCSLAEEQIKYLWCSYAMQYYTAIKGTRY